MLDLVFSSTELVNSSKCHRQEHQPKVKTSTLPHNYATTEGIKCDDKVQMNVSTTTQGIFFSSIEW